MPTELPTQGTRSAIGKKLWNKHQDKEYTKVSNYKEGLCFMCWKNKGVGATLIELCDKCMHKKGTEPILAVVGAKAYAMCFECGKWTFNVHNLNVRICQSCFHRFRKHFKNLRRKGVDNVDPFYVWARKQFGKDWKLLMNDGVSFRGI